MPITVVSRHASFGAQSLSISWHYPRQGPSSLEPVPVKFWRASLCTPLSAAERKCTGLWGSYYRGANFLGTPVASNTSPMIVAIKAADPVLPAPNSDYPDEFSAIWQGVLVPLPGVRLYRFWAGSDDAVRVTINGVRVVEDLSSPNSYRTTTSGNVLQLDGATTYPIRVDYRNFGGDAHLNLGWELVDTPLVSPGPIPLQNLKTDALCQLSDAPAPAPACSGVYVEYFPNEYFSGQPSAVVVEPSVNIDWTGNFRPGTASNAYFTARFTGCFMNPTAGTPNPQVVDATLRISAAHGIRLWVGVNLVAERWRTDTNDLSLNIRIPTDRCLPFVLEKLYLGDRPYVSFQWSYAATPTTPLVQSNLRPSRCSPDPDRSCSGLRAEYHPDYRTTAHPLVIRDSIVNNLWSDSQPTLDPSLLNSLANSFPRNDWGVTWRGVLRPLHDDVGVSKNYRFVVRADNGIKVTLNGLAIFPSDQYSDNPLRTLTSDAVTLVGGNWYSLEVEHFTRNGDSQFSLGWFIEGETEVAVIAPHFLRVSAPQNGAACGAEIPPAVPSCSGFFGEYFLGSQILGLPEQSAIEPTLDLRFTTSPFPSFPDRVNDWTARWSGCILSPFSRDSGDISVDLIIRADDSVRVWVGPTLVVEDTWGPGAGPQTSASLPPC
jgi:hypothetical protein